jgi:hypothetical protein
MEKSPSSLSLTWWEKANEAYWSFPEDTLDSPRRVAALLSSVISSGLLDPVSLLPFINRHLMPDIAMCTGGECPVKENCWRYMAPPDRYQSQFAAPPCTDEGCEYFWDMNEK